MKAQRKGKPPMRIFHTPRTRSLRVIWLCEEMDLPYEVTSVDFGAPTPEFLAANPLGALPAMTDGDVAMHESIAIMLYIMGKYGPTDLERTLADADYARYLQFLLFGEASMAVWGNPIMATRVFAPDADQANATIGECRRFFGKRLAYLEQELGTAPYILGEEFSAADISVGYPLTFARGMIGGELSPTMQAYFNRLTSRPAYQRAAAVK